MVGYNDKMTTLLETVIGKIADFEVKVDRFSVIKVMVSATLLSCFLTVGY
jgi:secreted Zn-dependent insulinase-like peptidase